MKKIESVFGLENHALPKSEILDVHTIFEQKQLRMLLHRIAAITELAVRVVDCEGKTVFKTAGFTCYCQKMIKDPLLSQICEASHAYGAVQSAVNNKMHMYFCPCGLIEVAIPVIVKDVCLGAVLIGQQRCDDAPDSVWHLSETHEQKKRVQAYPELKSVYEKVRTVTYQQFKSTAMLAALSIQKSIENETAAGCNAQTFMEERKQYEEILMLFYRDYRQKIEQESRFSHYLSTQFLLSGLTTLASLAIIEDAPRTNEATALFAGLVRNVILNEKRSETLESALLNTEYYLTFQQLRVGEERLTYEIENEVFQKNIKIPGNLFLPFMENLIFNGVMQTDKSCNVRIYVQNTQDRINILIEDNCEEQTGKYLTGEKINQKDGENYILSAMQAMESSLRFFYGSNFELRVQCHETTGTQIRFDLPESMEGRGRQC